MIIAITGVTGNMGQAALTELIKIQEIEKFKLLVLPTDKKKWNKLAKKLKYHNSRFEVVYGNLADKAACEILVKDADYVINMAAVIPPHSDQNPQKAIECNEIGVGVLVSAIEKMKKQPKFIHISTMALYGNRNSKHIWGRVGDPLLVSPFDIYAATKLRGEFIVLESNIENYVVLRQTAMLHHKMLSDNISDGLMFHTCFNAPLEWVTDNDSGVLIANIIKKDLQENLNDKFWKRCFNIGGGKDNQIFGYQTLEDGFKLIGGGIKDFFEPNYNSLRNFHGLWFYDGDKLNNLFNYQSQTTSDLWKEIKQQNPYICLGKIVPKKLIKKFVIQRLFKSPNAPKYWIKTNNEAKIYAYFGGKDKYDAIPKQWNKFPLLTNNKDESNNEIDYISLKENKNFVDFGIDIDKDNFSIEELRSYAKMHGGKLISTKIGGLYDKLKWQNSDGEIFEARPSTIVKAGHWFNITYKENAWDFDRLAKTDKICAQIWYDSHDRNEDKFYFFTKDFDARMK